MLRVVEAPHVGPNIRAARKARGWTKTELAYNVGVTETTINQWETGHREPSLAALRRVAAALDVPVAELLGE